MKVLAMLAELAENIKTLLAALPPEKWRGTLQAESWYIVPGPLFPIVNTLDPDEIINCKTKKIHITPIRREYGFGAGEKTGGRNQKPVRSYSKRPIISSVIGTPFSTIADGDAASWDEVKKILFLREKLEENIISLDVGYQLTNVETEDPVDIKLSERIFLCITDYMYETVSC